MSFARRILERDAEVGGLAFVRGLVERVRKGPAWLRERRAREARRAAEAREPGAVLVPGLSAEGDEARAERTARVVDAAIRDGVARGRRDRP